MADNNDYVPAQALNNYIWKLLQTKRGWTSANYGGKTPIIPATKQPEFISFGKPFICYGYSEETGGEDWFNVVSTAAYVVYGASDGVVNNTLRFLADAFRRLDESAYDINSWIHDADNADKAAFDGLTFQYTQVTNTQGPGPEKTEGGLVDGRENGKGKARNFG